jgi:sugar phosphate isomerase/epimerase
MKILSSTGSLYNYGLERAFSISQQAGFGGMEVIIDYKFDTRQPEYLNYLSKKYKLPIIVIHGPFFRVPGWPKSQVEAIKKTIKIAKSVGSKKVNFHLPSKIINSIIASILKFKPLLHYGIRAESEYKKWLKDEYKNFKKENDIEILIENLPARSSIFKINTYCWNNTQDILQFAPLTLDTTHLGTLNLDPVDVYKKLKDKIKHIHLSNFDKGKEHRRPEYGQLDLGKFLQELKNSHYNETMTLELHPDALGAGQPDEKIIKNLKESLNYCKNILNK